MNKYFPRDHRLYQVFNKKNPLKLSCNCISNMSIGWWNCRNKNSCYLDGTCLQTYIIHYSQGWLSSQINTVISTMVLVVVNLNFSTIITQIHFAFEITSKTQNFQNILGNYNTKVSASPTLKWLREVSTSPTAYVLTYRCWLRRCDHCLMEKYLIARADSKNLSNKKTELI